MSENSIHATVGKNLKGIKISDTSQRESGECSMVFCVRYLGYKSVSKGVCECARMRAHTHSHLLKLREEGRSDHLIDRGSVWEREHFHRWREVTAA